MTARNPSALVLAVDTPLVPEMLLEELMQSHCGGIMLASCSGEIEPLIGVHDKALAQDREKYQDTSDTSLRKLFYKVRVTTLEYHGDPAP